MNLEDMIMNGLMNLTLFAQQALPSAPETEDLLTGIDPGFKAGLLFAVLVAATVIIITLWCVAWNFGQVMHRHRIEAELKRDMLDRGMSADEVAKVIEATAPQGVAERWVASKNK
jgi:hypothetical protein